MPTHRITLDPGWRITDTVCGIPFVDGVAEVDDLDDHALARLSEMRPQVEAISAGAPVVPVVDVVPPAVPTVAASETVPGDQA